MFLSSHLLAEIEQMATRVGVLDRGRLVLQDQLDVLTAPTGCTVVTSAEPERVRAAMDGRVRTVEGERVVVSGADPAEVNARLVEAGIPVTGLALERPTLEAVVLGRCERQPGPGGGAVIGVELRKTVPPSSDLGHDRASSMPFRSSSRCCWRSPISRRGRVAARRFCPPS